MYIPLNSPTISNTRVDSTKTKAARSVSDDKQKERRRLPDRRRKQLPLNHQERRRNTNRRRAIRQGYATARNTQNSGTEGTSKSRLEADEQLSPLGQTIDISA